MKKSKSLLILLFGLFVVFQGCEKKSLTENNSNDKSAERKFNLGNIEITNQYDNDGESILCFNSLEDYENAVSILSENNVNSFNQLTIKNNFVSMKNAFSVKSEKIPIEDDDIITSLLNKKGEIQIADKVFHLNFKNEKVEVISNLLKDKNETISYSFDDDVLAKVFKTNYSDNYSKGSYCSGSTKTTYMNSSGGRIDCKVKYLKLGIYYKLYAKISKANSSAVKIGLTTIYYNKTKYQNKAGCWTYSGNKSGTGNSYTLTAYSGTRRLKAYIIPINFWYEYFSSSDNKGLNMSCGTPNC